MKPHELIEKGWCQGHLALDSNGKITAPEYADACAWCAVGALQFCYFDNGAAYSSALKKLGDHLNRTGHVFNDVSVLITTWNDSPTRTKEHVVSTLKLLFGGKDKA